MHDCVESTLQDGFNRYRIEDLERHDGHISSPRGGGPRHEQGLTGPDTSHDHVSVCEQPGHQPGADEAVGPGHEHSHLALLPFCSRSRSASTIIRINSSKVTVGSHPRTLVALPGSA